MKENMPGNGHRQTDGYVDRGPRVLKYRTKGVFTDKVFTVETFDSVSERGKFMQNIRDLSHQGGGVEEMYHVQGEGGDTPHGGLPRRKTRKQNQEQDAPYRDSMGQAGTARRHYTDTLREFFGSRVDQLEERDREHINSLMKGQSTRDSAAELCISQPAVVTARQRAIKRLVALVGTSNKDVANELVFYLKSEGGVALAGRLPDRVLAVSTVWRGHA